MTDGRVKCLDGSLVYVHQDAETVEVVVRGYKVTMTLEAASQLSQLLVPDRQAPKQPAPSKTSESRPLKRAAPTRVSRSRGSIAELLAEGLLPPLSILMAYHQGKDYEALVTDEGRLIVDDKEFDTPSAAAMYALGRQSWNGWTFWHFDGIPISNLRWRLRAKHFTNDQSDISDSYRNEKQSVINRWMEWALKRGFNPGNRDEDTVERFLNEWEYSPSTLNSYRRHLNEWFDIYDPIT
ncbi:hypothetical protein [Candidatus Poriferisocius sp.]|uniref:restriction system modified-DNA reader domain-containing protein n=1 Tax=Candidatus Poriferisocius sp. TaxID=3101276 RepID=UPI003B02AD5D